MTTSTPPVTGPEETVVGNLPAPVNDPGALAKTPTTAVAAQAKAAIEARYLVAMKQPRNWNTVRVKVLEACKRPVFAESARYSKPVGRGSVVGPSIRFAEEALRTMGNVLVDSLVLYDDDEQRIVRILGTDLESNLTYQHDIILQKTVERREARQGQEVLGRRTNSTGQQVYIVRATEDDLLIKQAAQASKAIRTIALRLFPSDILEESMDAVEVTVKNRDAADPAGARKRVCDFFYALGITPQQLNEYLGHPIEQMNNDELGMLREVYTAIKEGETTWAEAVAAKVAVQGEAPAKPSKDKGTGALEGALGAKKPGKAETPPPASDAQKPMF